VYQNELSEGTKWFVLFGQIPIAVLLTAVSNWCFDLRGYGALNGGNVRLWAIFFGFWDVISDVMTVVTIPTTSPIFPFAVSSVVLSVICPTLFSCFSTIQSPAAPIVYITGTSKDFNDKSPASKWNASMMTFVEDIPQQIITGLLWYLQSQNFAWLDFLIQLQGFLLSFVNGVIRLYTDREILGISQGSRRDHAREEDVITM
jgi:hypothetical protein